MNLNEEASEKLKFTKEDIYEEINKMFRNPFFVRSGILRRFLLFIVDETIQGHSNWLKEYTIGVKVLNKPTDFCPREDGIVRIHAARLRRALNCYYNEKGAFGSVHISIPKGRYVPVFQRCNETSSEITAVLNDNHNFPHNAINVAVIPFTHMGNDPIQNSLSNGLGLQISSALTKVKYFSVTAYHITRNLFENTNECRKIAENINADYIFSGNIQSIQNKFRIYMQLINTTTNKLVWSKMLERRLTDADIFDIQDEVVALVVPELGHTCTRRKLELQSALMIATA